ncbi:MAG: DUF2007 domain-containing protein [Chloroflexota bacterium]|nr:DUF2007 domain-containing protein [Chloroflexota bacterium]
MKWVPVITAPDQLTAESWQELLRGEGIPSMLRPQDAVSFLGPSTLPCVILVPQGMEQEAKAVLDLNRGDGEPFSSDEEL